MTIRDASEESGLSCYTLREYARRGEFAAYMMRGKKGGYEIEPRNFRAWVLLRRMRTGNGPARQQAKRELYRLGLKDEAKKLKESGERKADTGNAQDL